MIDFFAKGISKKSSDILQAALSMKIGHLPQNAEILQNDVSVFNLNT